MRPTTVANVIRLTPGVCGGEARVGDKRVTVWMLVQAKRIGIPDEELLNRYVVPITSEELEAAWDYYRSNPEEIEAAIRRNEEE